MDNSPTNQLADVNLKSHFFSKHFAELTRLRKNQSATWLTASWFVGELSVKPKFHLLHHIMTCYLAHEFWYRKNSHVLCRACCKASATQHVTMSAASETCPSPRVQQAWYATKFVSNVYKVMIAVIRFNKRINFICELKRKIRIKHDIVIHSNSTASGSV